MVIDFSASWCGPCQYMEPILKDFSIKYGDVEFVKIDVDELSVCSRINFCFPSGNFFNFNVNYYTYVGSIDIS